MTKTRYYFAVIVTVFPARIARVGKALKVLPKKYAMERSPRYFYQVEDRGIGQELVERFNKELSIKPEVDEEKVRYSVNAESPPGRRFEVHSSDEFDEGQQDAIEEEISEVRKDARKWGSNPNPPLLVGYYLQAEEWEKALARKEQEPSGEPTTPAAQSAGAQQGSKTQNPTPAEKQAYDSYVWVNKERPDLAGNLRAGQHFSTAMWEYVKDSYSEGDYEVPEFETWKRYIRGYLQKKEGKKNTPRAGREGKNIVKQNEINPEDLPKRDKQRRRRSPEL